MNEEIYLKGKKIVTIFLSDDFIQIHEDGTFTDNEEGFESTIRTLNLIANKLPDYEILIKPHPKMSEENIEKLVKYYQ